MRYAIISDIHANWQAWRAVQTDIGTMNVDRIICLGDMIGYGPRPADVLDSMYASVHHFIMGNHEAALLGLMDEDLFNDTARWIIRWSRDRLNARAIRFLRRMPLSLKGADFRCAHAEFSEPGQFFYIVEPEDAAPSWTAVAESPMFVGHTHRPGIYLLGESGTPRRVDYQDVEIEDGKRFLINVGSVGSPRDGDPRACYSIYDAAARAVYYRRVPFDLDAFREDLRRAGLPEEAGRFLEYDPARRARPVREALGFRPAASREEGVRDAVEVQDIQALRARVRAWRLAAGLLGVLLVAAAAVAPSLLRRMAVRKFTADLRAGRPPAERPAPDVNALGWGGLIDAAGLPGWKLTLENRDAQSFEPAGEEAGQPILRWTSNDRDHAMILQSVRLPLDEGRRFTAAAMFRKGSDFEGTIAVQTALLRASDGRREWMEHFLVKEPTMRRAGGWEMAQKTETAPAGTVAAEFRIVGRFTGSVEITDPQFYLRE